MDEDDIDDDSDDEDEDDDNDPELPVFNLDELAALGGPNGSNGHSHIAIEERTIINFSEIVDVANKENKSVCVEGCIIKNTGAWSPQVDISIDDSVFLGPIECRDRRAHQARFF